MKPILTTTRSLMAPLFPDVGKKDYYGKSPLDEIREINSRISALDIKGIPRCMAVKAFFPPFSQVRK